MASPRPVRPRPWFCRGPASYGFALLCSVALLAISWLFQGPLNGVLYSVPIAVIALITLAWGTGPGLASTVLLGAGLWTIGRELPVSLASAPPMRDSVRLAGYLFASLIVVAVIHVLHGTRRRLAQAHAEAERATAEQREQAERLRALAENSPEAIARFDRDLRHVYLNAHGARIYGVTVAEALGRTSAELGMPADKVAFWRERFEQVFATGREQTVDFEFASPELGHRHFSSLFVPERDESGRVATILAITRDVTEQRRIEEELRASEQRYRSVLENLSEGLMLFDPGGNLIYQNPASLRIHGFEPQGGDRIENEILRTLWEAWDQQGHPLTPDEWPVSRVFRGERFQDVILHVRRVETGQEFDGSYNGCPIVDPAGRIEAGFITIHDITEETRAQRALRESEARFRDLAARKDELLASVRGRELEFRTLIENLHSGVALIDAEGRFTLVNERFLELFGFERETDILNVNSRDWRAWQVHDESERLLDVDEHPVRRATLARQAVRNQLVGVRRPGERDLIWILVTAAPLFRADGALEHVICTYHDITDRKRAEEALRASKAELSRLVEALREADRRKNEFLAVLSHELRNPLAPIRNSLYVLRRAQPDGEHARQALGILERQSRHLTRLVDDLLDLNRIERGKVRLQREDVRLDELVVRVAEDLRNLFERGGVRLDIEVPSRPLHVHGDPTRIAQMVGNLLQNSAKFTQRGGWTRLSLAELDGRARIEVSDNGTGISPALLPRLFESFVQSEVTIERANGGLGLGLALVKGLAELHAGSVAARSEGLGRGATFTLDLPIQAGPAEGPGRAAAPAVTQPCSSRVLVIEDNLDTATSLKEALELNGHAVEVATTGTEGLAMALARVPDVVLCDLGLPEMDGHEIARALRRDPRFEAVRLVALSGYALPEDVERSEQAGFDRHLAKPPNIDELEKVLCAR